MRSTLSRQFLKGRGLVYNDYTSSFKELLRKSGSVSIHHHNIQLVATEMCKVKNGLHVDLISCLFEMYPNPKDNRTFIIPRVKSEYMGKHSLRYFGPVVWENMLPEKYKEIVSLDKFKRERLRDGFQKIANVGCAKCM